MLPRESISDFGQTRSEDVSLPLSLPKRVEFSRDCAARNDDGDETSPPRDSEVRSFRLIVAAARFSDQRVTRSGHAISGNRCGGWWFVRVARIDQAITRG